MIENVIELVYLLNVTFAWLVIFLNMYFLYKLEIKNKNSFLLVFLSGVMIIFVFISIFLIKKNVG
ncbi:MAG: hypothetical protein WHT27_07370 [candidate division WOR-3 bacterium]